MKLAVLCLLALMVSAPKALAWNSPAPDVVLYCTPELEGALRQVVARYSAASSVEVHIFVAPPDGLIGLIRHRARDDVVFADVDTINALAKAALVDPGTVITLGRDPYVLIAKTGVDIPPGASAADLVATHVILVTDPTTAASFDGAAVLQAALPSVRPPRLVGVHNTQAVIVGVRDNAHFLGVVSATEAQAAGIARAGALSAAPPLISGARVTLGQSANAASLLDFIAGEQGKAILQSTGLEAP